MFKIDHRSIDDVEPFEYIPGAAGLALCSAAVLTSGALAKATGTTMPTHIIMGKDSDGNYAALRILRSTIFDVEATATIASSVVGSAVTIGTDAASVTATTTDGVFVITATDGAKSVKGYFNV